MLDNNRTNKNMVFKSNEAINSILNYHEPSFLSVVEIIYNKDVLDTLSSIDYTEPNYNKIYDALYPDNINNLKLIKKHTSRNRHNCSYRKTISGKGRYYIDSNAKKSHASLQNCQSRVRRLIVDGKLVATDLSNAHLEIVKNLAKMLQVPDDKYEILNYYCENRNQVLNDIMKVFDCDREVAKNYFIIVLFGGSYDTWIVNNNLLSKSQLKTEFMMKFEFAFDIIKQELNKLDVFNGFKVLEKQINKKKDWKIEKTALAIFLQEIESKILVAMYQYLESKGCIIRIPIHDGIWFDDCKNITNKGTSIEFLKELSNEIKDKLGLIIPLDYEDTSPDEDDLKWYANHKEFYDKYNETKHSDKNIIDASDDDEGASRIVINKFNDRLIRCEAHILVKYNNYWVYNKDEVNRFLSNMIKDSNIYFYGSDGKRLYNYSNAVSHQLKCITAIRNSDLIKIDNVFLKNIGFKNRSYLPFLNGIWSMKDKKLFSYDELPDIHFLSIINHNLEEFNEDKYNEVMNKVVNPIFPNPIERDYFAHICSRAIAGHNEDKKWFGLGGARNSGKGVLTDCFANAFDKYFSTFNSKCLIINKHGNPEADRALGWVVDHIITRMLWSNEIETEEEFKDENDKKFKEKIILNGAFIKTLASGGDEMQGRQIYEKSIKFKPSFTIQLNYNDLPNISVQDALENFTEFACKSKFVVAEELIEGCDYLKLRDENIKLFIANADIINAFTWWILNAYSEIKSPPDVIKTFNNITKEDTKLTPEIFVAKYFKNSKSNKDRLFISEIQDILSENNFNISTKKLNKIFEAVQVGIYNTHTCKDGADKKGYTNIIYVKPESVATNV